MNELINKYLDESITEAELDELHNALSKDKELLRQFISEIQLSNAIEDFFDPERSVNITELLAKELNGALSEEELREYIAAGRKPLTGLSDIENIKPSGCKRK